MLSAPSPRELTVARLHEIAGVMLQIGRDAAMLRQIGDVAASIVAAYRAGGKVVLCGNGGSAADAQHIAAEMVGRFLLERAPLPAIALSTNTSSVTAIANDYAFADVFRRQVEAFVSAGDVLVGISTSGNSENVIVACDAARRRGAVTVGLTGEGGGRLADVVDRCLRIPTRSIPRIQEGHIAIGHILCEIVEAELFGAGDSRRAVRPGAAAPANLASTMSPLVPSG
jgi:D-sedoheptulose 7-phosphate isomerase